MTFPKFVEKHRKMTDLWPKKSVFGDFRVKTWLFLRLVNFKKLHFLGELLMMGGYFFLCGFTIHLSRNVVHDFFQFSFFADF
jgi:hypothetical protein